MSRLGRVSVINRSPERSKQVRGRELSLLSTRGHAGRGGGRTITRVRAQLATTCTHWPLLWYSYHVTATTVLRILHASPAALSRYYPSCYPAMTCGSDNHAYSVVQHIYYHPPTMMPRQWPHWHTSSTHHTYGSSKHIAPPTQVPGPWEPPLEFMDVTTGPKHHGDQWSHRWCKWWW